MCDICDSVTTCDALLWSHSTEIHKENEENIANVNLANKEPEDPIMSHKSEENKDIEEEVADESNVNKGPEHHVDLTDTVVPLNQEVLPVICGQCSSTFQDENECIMHMNNHLFNCYKCPYESVDLKSVRRNEKDQHILLSCDKSSHEGQQCDMVGKKKNNTDVPKNVPHHQ